MGKEERTSYTIKVDDSLGEVQVSNEVVAVIAGLSAMDIEGVASMAGNTTRELISKLGIRSLSKGVTAEIVGDVAKINLSLTLKYGYSIMDVSAKVQEKVKVTVENMTGLNVADVNIRVTGVEVEK